MVDNCNDKFDAYLDQNAFYHFEGPSGVRRVETIVQDIGGYSDICEFLADNPAACDAIVQFVRAWLPRDPEWKNKLESLVENVPGEDDEDEDEDSSDAEGFGSVVDAATISGNLVQTWFGIPHGIGKSWTEGT